MKTGDIILIPFPFSELTRTKVRPALVVALTKDKYKDIIVTAISSVIPSHPNENEIIIEPSETNKLRSRSIIKVDRIVTLKKEDLIANLGKLTAPELNIFKEQFRKLV